MDVQAEKKECRSDFGSCDKQLIYPRFMQLNSKQPNSNCWGRWGTIRRKGNIEDFFRVLLDLRAMFSQKFARFLSRDSWRQAYTWWMEKAQGTWKIISVTSSLFVASSTTKADVLPMPGMKQLETSFYLHIHFLVTFTVLSCSLH